MIRKLIISIILLVFICINTASSQQRYFDNDILGMVFVSLGNHNLDFTELETALSTSSLDYPPLATDMYTFGAGGVISIKDWIIAAEGVGLMSKAETFGPYQSRLSGGYVTLNTGFMLKKSRSIVAYPLIGIGGGSINFKVFQEPQDLLFSDIIEQPYNEITLDNKSIFLHLGMSLQYNIHTFRDDQDSGNFFIGVKAGYKTTIKSFDWYIKGTSTKLSEGPVTGLDGYYVEIIFGISGISFSYID